MNDVQLDQVRDGSDFASVRSGRRVGCEEMLQISIASRCRFIYPLYTLYTSRQNPVSPLDYEISLGTKAHFYTSPELAPSDRIPSGRNSAISRNYSTVMHAIET